MHELYVFLTSILERWTPAPLLVGWKKAFVRPVAAVAVWLISWFLPFSLFQANRCLVPLRGMPLII